jgi:adenylate kinase
MNAPVYVLLGPPGGGKGTQARLLKEALGAAHLSSGDLLRAAIALETPLGKQVAPLLLAGKLVPTNLLLPIIEEAIAAIPAVQPVLLDGVPRSRGQAILLDELLTRQDRAVQAALLLEVPRDELVKRLLSRGRADDDPAVIAERLDIYERERDELRGYYEERGLLHVVDGTGEPAEVSGRLLEVISGVSPG